MRDRLFKMSLVIGIVFLLIGVSSGPGANVKAILDDDEVDQEQTTRSGDAAIGGFEVRVAQSFKPSLNRLTRVELFAIKEGNPSGDLQISIKLSLDGEDLTSVKMPAEEITQIGDWYFFDFKDIFVNPEHTYYILWTPDSNNWDIDNLVLWGCNWYGDLYPRGNMWNEYPPGNWVIENPEWDCCFKTYGFNTENYPPNPPDINGPSSGKVNSYYPYTFVTDDPNGDDVLYEIDWGDGTTSSWDGPFDSNELITRTHQWFEKGTFTIKARAKDIYGAIGDRSTFHVTMPRNRATYNSLFLRFLEQFPILQKYLQSISSYSYYTPKF